MARTPTPRRAEDVPGWLIGVTFRLGWGLLKVAARFVSGRPLSGRPLRTDATFLGRASTQPETALPGPLAFLARWSHLAGWQRAGIRLVVAAAVLVALQIPRIAGVVLVVGILAALVVTVWRWWRKWQRRAHVQKYVKPAYLTLCQYLGTDPKDDPEKWVSVPLEFKSDPDAVIEVHAPAGWDAHQRHQTAIDGVIRRHLGSDLKSSWTADTGRYRRPKALPKRVAFDGYDLPGDQIHIATEAGGRKVIIDVTGDEPHGFVTAGTGGGKSTTLGISAAHQRSKGFLVDMIDPKRRSYTGMLDNVPGIRVHTDAVSMMEAVEEFYLSMIGVNTAIEAGADPESFPQRTLVFDEFGTFMSAANVMWKRAKSEKEVTGDSVVMAQFMQIGWQGRAANHRMIVGVHQPNPKLFGGTDGRGLFGWRAILGGFDRSRWLMAFSYAKALTWDGRRKGRGVIGFGNEESSLRVVQFAYLEKDEIKAYALTNDDVPDWYANRVMPPWVTQSVHAEGEKVAGLWQTDAVSLPGTYVPPAAIMPRDVPGTPATPGTSPSVTSGPEMVPVRVNTKSPNSAPIPTPRIDGESINDTPVTPVGPSADAPVIVGLRGAAEFLGMEFESFRKARARAKKKGEPIPSERVTADGQPSWTKAALRSWHSKRPRAGARDIDDLGNDV